MVPAGAPCPDTPGVHVIVANCPFTLYVFDSVM
jgi:hypothetical protein